VSVVYVALPVALLIALAAVIAFVIQVRNGQFDDLESPPRRMLFDDVEHDDVEHDDVEHDDVAQDELENDRPSSTASGERGR
jgi:cbb3-type cytochrome oxidase maturation protein